MLCVTLFGCSSTSAAPPPLSVFARPAVSSTGNSLADALIADMLDVAATYCTQNRTSVDAEAFVDSEIQRGKFPAALRPGLLGAIRQSC